MAPLSSCSHIFHMYLVIFKKTDPGAEQRHSGALLLNFLNFLDQAIKFMIGNFHLSFDGIDLI